MTLVMNQLIDSKITEANDEEEKGNKSTKKQEDDALFLWDCVSLFDTEDEVYIDFCLLSLYSKSCMLYEPPFLFPNLSLC